MVKSGARMRKVMAIVAIAASACGPTAMAAYGLPPCTNVGGPYDCFAILDGGTKDGG